MSIFGRLFAYTKTGLRLQSFSRSCILGGRFFRFNAKPSCCFFSAKRPRMDVVLLSNEFDISSNSLSGAVHGCIAPDRGYPPPPVPLLSSVPPCTLLNVEFAPQTRCCIEPPPSVAVLNAYLRVHFWLRGSDKAETSLLRGTSNIHVASELTHPCQCLDVSLRAANSLLPNTTAILGGSEQNSKQPNVHGCTFGCDGIRGGSELAFLSIKTDNKCSEPYDDFSLIHLEDPIRQNLS